MKRAIFNQKGGVGKTSITCNLAAAFAKMGRKTLIVDLDSQANATQYVMGERANSITSTIADFYSSTLSISPFKNSLEDAVYRTAHKNLFIIPSEKSLSDLQPKLEARYKIFKLQQALEILCEEQGFDEVLFDTPPALNFYSMSAMMAADTVLVPFDCDAFSEDALHHVQDIVDEISADHNDSLRTEGVIVNHYMANAKLPQKAIESIRGSGFTPLHPFLSSSIVMRESHAESIPLVYFKPNHKLAGEFMELAAGLPANHFVHKAVKSIFAGKAVSKLAESKI
jgi:chromosome partitioning protein